MELLSVREAAEELGVSPGRVRQFCQEGRLGRQVGWQWVITREELESFKQRPRPTGRPPKSSTDD